MNTATRLATTGQASAAHIDHDHRTDKLRGTLCGACNRRWGHLDEYDQVLLAIDYLRGRRCIVSKDDEILSSAS